MNQLLLTLACLALTACGSKGGGAVSAAANLPALVSPSQPGDVADPLDPSLPIATPTPVPVAQAVALTYYSLTQTRTQSQVSGFTNKTYTVTGSCVVYQSQTYCWDDGVKTLTWTDFNNHTYGPFTYDFWGLSTNSNGNLTAFCNGACGTDFLDNYPMQDDQEMSNNVPAGSISQVLTSGIAHAVSCTINGNSLDCIDFTINLGQTPL